MKKIIILMAVATLLISLPACKKENNSQNDAPLNSRFAPEALAYVELPVGRYFIYKDSASATLDSVVVTQSKTEQNYVAKYNSTSLFTPSNPAYTYQAFTLQLTKFSQSQEIWFTGNTTSLGNSLTPVATDTASLNLSLAFWYPFTQNFIASVSSLSFIQSINIEGKNYSNVVVFISGSGVDATSAGYFHNAYYWVKGIGIIKRELRTSTSIKTDLLVRNS